MEGRISPSIRRHIAKRSTGLAKDALVSPSCSPASGKRKIAGRPENLASFGLDRLACRWVRRRVPLYSGAVRIDGIYFWEVKACVPDLAPSAGPFSKVYALKLCSLGSCMRRRRSWGFGRSECGILVDPASSHMLVSKIKPCMSKFTPSYGETANGSLNQSRFLR